MTQITIVQASVKSVIDRYRILEQPHCKVIKRNIPITIKQLTVSNQNSMKI